MQNYSCPDFLQSQLESPTGQIVKALNIQQLYVTPLYFDQILILHSANNPGQGFRDSAQKGSQLGEHETLKWLLIPLALVLGLVIAWAEPMVKILCSQVEETTTGYVRSGMLQKVISLGVGIFAALGVLQILAGFPLHYILLPGYLLVLGMMFMCNQLFIGIAFDSCAVSTGSMVITFVMALAIGLA